MTTSTDAPVRCRTCMEEGRKSRVFVGGYSSTSMGSLSFYDEEGVFHSHDPNNHSSHYSCSNGHQWAVTVKIPCRACDYNG